jgi:hypothetical protein
LCRPSLKYPVIEIIIKENFIIAFTNFFSGKLWDGHFDIKLWENTTHRKGEWGNRIATKRTRCSSR